MIRSLNPIGGNLIPRIKFWPASYIEWRGKPGTIRVDNGPEYISGKLLEWASSQGGTIQHIQPGQPKQNAYIRCPADDARIVERGALQPHCPA